MATAAKPSNASDLFMFIPAYAREWRTFRPLLARREKKKGRPEDRPNPFKLMSRR
jgi:hypothetical protein